MARDFYPRQEGTILSFTRMFSDRIALAPADYGVSIEQCEQYAATQQAFADAYRITNDPTIATRPSRMAKNAAAAALEDATRFLARIIRAHPGVTTTMRIELGLSEADAGEAGAAVGPPKDQPLLIVRSIIGRQIRIQLRDDAYKRRKPAGVIGALLFVVRDEQASADLADWTFMEVTTRARATLTFGTAFPAGAKVWMRAQWFSTTGARGPASEAVCAYLQGGLVSPANIARLAA
jgi:hypothetical protein